MQPVTGISLNKTSLSLECMDEYQLIAKVSPTSANDKTVKWSSSDENVVTVDENGLIKAVAKGEAIITVEAVDGSGKKKECKVTVSNNGYIVTDIQEFESSHPYNNNTSDFWEYEIKDASGLVVKFDENIEVEEGFDYLYIYDFENESIDKYTGSELKGKTINVSGSKVRIKLVADGGGNAYGFKVVEVKAEVEPTATPTVEPTATPTVAPTSTPTPEPTATPVPSETATPVPSETATPVPSETATPVPTETATPTPSETVLPTPEETVTPESSETVLAYLLGDVDDDGSISASDALLALKHAAKITKLTDTQLLAADTSKDSSVDASDALLILKYAAKLINSFE